MKIEEAIVYVMVQRNGGMTTDQIAEAINRQRLHIRKDGKPVTSAQVYAVVCRFPEVFTKEAGRIMLIVYSNILCTFAFVNNIKMWSKAECSFVIRP